MMPELTITKLAKLTDVKRQAVQQQIKRGKWKIVMRTVRVPRVALTDEEYNTLQKNQG